jgi:drug/metabolite transporter (DMT)-like permease
MTHRQATVALVTITVLWGVSIVAIKYLLSSISPLYAIGIRFGIAGLILSPTLRYLTRHELIAGIVIGISFALGVGFQNVGLDLTTPSRSAFIVAISALLTPAFGAGFLRHHVPRSLVVKVLVALLGVYLLTAPTGSLSDINRGDWFTLVSAVLYAVQIVAIGHYALGTSTARILAIQFLVASAVGFLGAATIETTRLELSPVVIGLIIFLICNSILTFWLQIRAQRVVMATEAALVFTFEPVAAGVMSYLVFGERLAAIQLLGGAIIMVAIGWPRRRTAGLGDTASVRLPDGAP